MDIAPLLGAINVPTLVMHGTEDRNVPLEVGRHLAQHFPAPSSMPSKAEDTCQC